jgi:hypothetical protein
MVVRSFDLDVPYPEKEPKVPTHYIAGCEVTCVFGPTRTDDGY